MPSYHGPRQAVSDIGDNEALNFGDGNDYDFIYNTSPNPSRFELGQGGSTIFFVEDGQQSVTFPAGIDPQFPDGSEADPSISFNNDDDTGFWRIGADEIGLATNGTERLRAGTGEIVVNEAGNDYDTRIEGSGEANLLFVDAGNDRVGIGTGTPAAALELGSGDLRIPTGNAIEDGSGTQRLVIANGSTDITDQDGNRFFGAHVTNFTGNPAAVSEARSGEEITFIDRQGSFDALNYSTSASAPGTLTLDANTFVKDGAGLVIGDTTKESSFSSTFEVQALGLNSADSAYAAARYSVDAGGPQIVGGKSRSGTVGNTGTAVQSGDTLLNIQGFGDDGTNLDSGTRAAQILLAVDDAVATNQVPGRIAFQTADSTGTLTEALRIDSAQDVIVQNGNVIPDAAGNRQVGTSSTHFSEMHAGEFTTHSPDPRDWPEALETIKEYAADYGSMNMGEMVANLVTVVEEQQKRIEQLEAQA